MTLRAVEELESWYAAVLSTVSVEFTFDVTPEDYLRFAREDIAEADSARTRVNALGNAKRSTHLQIDSILDALGLPGVAKMKFPAKLELCGRCGIVAPSIVGRLNGLRNLVEHEYYVPTREEVEMACDVTELFLGASERLLRQFPLAVHLQPPRTEPFEELQCRLEPRSGLLEVTPANAPEPDPVRIRGGDGVLYERWISLLVRKTR